tara:strand:- start:1121 stop:2023 length:903 start_codon:yes stop_codon:yes gene_type:complete
MRRGKLNFSSLIFIFLVALFTILSYGFDQMVIRSEDNIRNLKIEYQNINNNYLKHESISETMSNIAAASDLNLTPILLRRNLLIKSYLLSSIKLEGGTLDFFNRKSDKINSEDLGRMILQDLSKVTDMQYELRSQFQESYLTNNEFIDKISKEKFSSFSDLYTVDLDPFKNDRDQFFIKDIIIYTKLIGYNYHWKDKSYAELKEYRNKAIKNFEDKNWYDVYRYKMLLLKKIDNETRILNNFVDMVDLKSEDLENELNEQISKLKTSNLKKNFYILLSILFQITSLLFLLLLFRSFITKV